ncbi:hypothetical protein [Ktedonospora formicarum]|uniref:Uncharacterized protein n=1 Tax=Ktedonospora formicarum TaxID=2778364 RepID=A0A8J3I2L7_9CHLR|nr:hypothetical protein [Ktedonospora formicarum]GHO48179.1 hypothetical protein KSX_63420 [Ktedonospora formicarum]
MPEQVRRIIFLFLGINLLIVAYVFFHPFGESYRYIQLTTSLLGGLLTCVFALRQPKKGGWEQEPWLQNERGAWFLVGLGLILWGCGEAVWRYNEATGVDQFPSYADLGYVWLPICCFVGFLLLPSPGDDKQKRFLVFLDSLIAMGALLAIGWYLLLGALAQDPETTGLSKFLGLYYPTTDVALISCLIFLLLRGQGRVYQAMARRYSLFTLGIGLCFFSSGDFLFNLEQQAEKLANGNLPDYLWPIGLVTIAMAGYLRYALPMTSEEVLGKRQQRTLERRSLGLAQLIPYALIALLFIALAVNVLSLDAGQVSIRPVFMIVTIIVVALVVLRQILTIRDNERLAALQAQSIKQIEQQARLITERNIELEEGIAHLKAVQTSLANGNLRARAQLKQGVLWDLTGSLNLLADRLMKQGQSTRYIEQMKIALDDLSQEVERVRRGAAFQLPASCRNIPEILPLVYALGLQKLSPQQPQRQPTQGPPNPGSNPGFGRK